MGEKNRAGAADSKTGSSPEKRKGAPYWIKTITEKGVDGLATILMTFIFILGLAQVIWRWILNDPIVWSEEMIRLTYVWICYLGWVIAEKADSHIRITAILNMLPKKAQKWLQFVCHIITIAFSLLMVYYGIFLVQAGTKRTAVSFKMNFSVVYLICPICNAIIIAYEIAACKECLTEGPRDYRDKGGDEQ